MSSGSRKMEEDLDYVEGIVMSWANERAMIWVDGEPDDVNSYVEAVLELPSLRRAPWKDREQLDRVLRALAVATATLTEEFRCMLVLNSEAVDGDWLMTCENDVDNPSEVGSSYYASDDELEDHDNDEDIPVAHPVTEFSASFDPVPPERVKDLNVIVKCMARIGALRECMQVYVNVRKTVLGQSLYRLGLEKMSPELLPKMDFEAKIRKWLQAIKVSVKVVLPAEKSLCDRTFAGFSAEAAACFREVASGSFLQFLAFSKAVAMANRTPEKLFKILEMHELLEELQGEICDVYESESVRAELKAAVRQLGVAVRGILQELEALIQMDSTKTPVSGGSHHPLVRYVMNYIRLLVDFTSPLDRLLGDGSSNSRREAPRRSLGFESLPDTTSGASPLAVQIMWFIVHLETNLINAKSQLYHDPGLSFLFLMNNTNYIVRKVKETEGLAPLLGDAWIQAHSHQVEVYAENYTRAAWQKVVLWVTSMPPKSRLAAGGMSPTLAIKERLKNFNLAFEEACRAQSNAIVPDTQLRERLRKRIAERLLPSYGAFLDGYGNYLGAGKQRDKFLKYSADDLENCLIDLFDP